MKSVVVMCTAWVGLAVIVFAPRLAAAQSLGTVSTNLNNPLPSCPEARGFATQHDIGVSMTCYNATLTACASDDDLDFIFGIANAGGLRGTIVMFDGGNGQHAAQTPDFLTYVRDYVNAGYQVVQIAWGSGTSGSSGAPWEETAINQGSTNTSYSIRKAACRPATFLNWVRNGNSGTGNGIWGGQGGMCAHGRSAGSGALAYALAWYNAGAASASNGQGYLDKVVLEDGPVFSDIERGCEIFGDGANAYNNQTTIICQNSTQAGCQGWTIPQDSPGGTLEYMGSIKVL